MPGAVVSFDCWNTLLQDTQPEAARGRRVAAVQEVAGPSLGGAQAAALLDDAVARHSAAWRAGEQYGVVRIAEDLARRLGADAGREAELAERLVASDPATIAATPGAREVMTALRHAGYALALVCDTGLVPGVAVRDLLDHHGLLEPLDALAFSDEVGAPKPDRRMFDAVLEPLGAHPGRSAHVGDLVATDVVGARRAGMRTVLFTGITPPHVAVGPGPAATPDRTISRLTDLPAALETA